jgi:GNAT superfamily N-acetyltransferase
VARVVTLAPMTPAAYEAWLTGAIEHYAQARSTADATSSADALERARTQFAELLPDGLDTPEHELLTLHDGDQSVGMVWLHTRSHPDGDHVFGYDFEVRTDLRRRGYGRAAMEAVEARCRARGIVALELNVFGDNLGARALYEEMGFAATALQMRKQL